MTKSPKPKVDRRLLGVWKSDRARTFRNYKPSPKATPSGTGRFKAIFGKLRVRWTRKYLTTEYEGVRLRTPYTVVATDELSVVILLDNSQLRHITFEGRDHYWLGVQGILCEHFGREKLRARRHHPRLRASDNYEA
jgi:hypothetical protein